MNWIKSLLLRLIEWLLGDSLPGVVIDLRKQKAKNDRESNIKEAKSKKCYIVEFIYSDNTKRKFHTRCNNKKLEELSPAFGRSLVNQPKDAFSRTSNGQLYPCLRGIRDGKPYQEPYDGVVLLEVVHSSHQI
jgi:hypothetical protein